MSLLTFRVLGNLAVHDEAGNELHVVGSRRRLLLLRLLLAGESAVPADRLADDVWDGRPPAGVTSTLQSHISLLRGILGPDGIQSKDRGYRISLAGAAVDSVMFEDGVRRSRDAVALGDMSQAASELETSLGLWRGPAYAEVADREWAIAAAVRLDEMRISAVEEWLAIRLELGELQGVIADAEFAVAEHPLREGLWATLMLAFYRSGRQSDALRSYQRLRTMLGDQLGIEPSRRLVELERAVLDHDRVLLEAAAPPGRVRRADRVPPGVSPEVSPEVPLGARPDGAVPSMAVAELHRVPLHLSEFVDRQRLLDDADHRLRHSRMVTLFGTAGCGKTRLAVELAARCAARFSGGVWWVDLASVRDGAFVGGAVAAALDLPDHQAVVANALSAVLGGQPALIILDNCEHLVEASGNLALTLLTECRHLSILATSREALGVEGEALLQVLPMTLPPDDPATSEQDVLRSEAMQLFVSRARRVDPGFEPHGERLKAVASICRRLDGIPLAIELAAALIGLKSVEDLVGLLDRRFDVLTQGARHADDRQRTLRSAIAWSFNLLSDTERELFVQLSVFVGDFAYDAAEAVGSPGTGGELFQAFAGLVRKSMVVAVPGSGEHDRYRLLESLREFGHEQLVRSGDLVAVQRLHAEHFAQFAEAAQRKLHSQSSEGWSDRTGRELPNLRAAIECAFSTGDLDTGVRLAGALRWTMGRLGHLGQAREWLATALAQPDLLTPKQHLQVVTAAITVAFCDGDYSGTAELGELALSLADEFGDDHELAVACLGRACTAIFEGNLDRANECLSRSHRYFQEGRDPWGVAWTLTCLGIASRRADDLVLAGEQLRRALGIFRSLDDVHGQVIPLVQLALLAQRTGDVAEAEQLAEVSLNLARQLGDRQLTHVAVCIAGRVALDRGDVFEARDLLVDSLVSFPGAEHKVMIAVALEGLAIVAQRLHDTATAVALWALSHDRRAEWQIPLVGARLAERQRYVAQAHEQLTPGGFADAWANGQLLDVVAAVRLTGALV